MDDLGLVKSVDCFSECVVVAVANAADRRLDPGFSQTLAVIDRDVLASTIAVVDQAAAINRLALVQSLLDRVKQEARMRRSRDVPANYPSGIGIDDEGQIDETIPGANLIEVGDPEPVWCRRMELAVHIIQRARSGLVWRCGFDRLPADNPV